MDVVLKNAEESKVTLLGRTIEKFKNGFFINKNTKKDGYDYYYVFQQKDGWIHTFGQFHRLHKAREACKQ